ncbi:MAG: hypothetical protein ACRC9L_03325 [Brevinema sp.]
MNITHDNDTIQFNAEGVNKLGFTNYTEELWEIIKNYTWSVKKDNNGLPKYLLANKLGKTLHQVVIDYYFTEKTRIDAYDKGYIIEHLDNNGFNCKISNLYFMKKLMNTYKGWGFDKNSKESIPIVAIKMFHIIETKRFQITLAFNTRFTNTSTGKDLCSVKFLYDTSYEIVFQDAETILDYIVTNMHFDIIDLRELLRYKDYRLEEYENFDLTEEYANLQGGNCIVKDGKVYIVQGFDEKMRIHSIHYDKEWQ